MATQRSVSLRPGSFVGVALAATCVVAAAGCRKPAGRSDARPVSVVHRAAVAAAGQIPVAPEPPGFRKREAGLAPDERAGREIWMKATAGNSRFHTYTFQQRLGVLIDWFRVLGTPGREDRFKAWGLINDPDCCAPGSPNCPAKTAEETYGFDWCPGDEALLPYVGKQGYRDPACDFKDPNGLGNRQDPCDLAFGTSTGALGLRKFPNPRFDAQAWRKLNGGKVGTWAGYDTKLSQDKAMTDSRVSRLADGSVEPPFLVGMSCGACHIAFDPLHPPADPTHPKWDDIKGAVGNQYARFSEIMASGMPTDSIEWQIFAHARPGTVDTSAVPNDQVHNPGTMNSILNLPRRPTFPNEQVSKWRPTGSCEGNESTDVCWCEPGKPGKCWARKTMAETVHHILKGGEDSVGIQEAIQRVYFNIGSCSEACWVNHLTDLRQVDPTQRNFGQTPFEIGQCRRDCPNFRAIEDRLPSIAAFLLSKDNRATDLAQARDPDPATSAVEKQKNLVAFLESKAEFGPKSVERGRKLFADNCARCHSSQPEPFEMVDFRALVANPPGGAELRADWLGSDDGVPATQVGTFQCRSLHSNHMVGHVWEQYASETYHARAADPGDLAHSGGGRGYYRAISLVSLWAYAPFMHDNAIGPEVCGRPANAANDFYRSSYVDADGRLLRDPPACVPYDPSVNGRYQLFKASVDKLLNPETRGTKTAVLDEPIRIEIGPRIWDGNKEKRIFGITLEIPPGIPASLLGNLQHKQLVIDLVLAKTNKDELKKRLAARLPDPKRVDAAAVELGKMADELLASPQQIVVAVQSRWELLKELYESCTALDEAGGHTFGKGLAADEKKALTAFLATL